MPALIHADSLWRDKAYRRLLFSLLLSAFAAQITALTLALTAAVQLRATATQIATLGIMGVLPYVLFLLPAGVWLDRRRKLPAYLAGELVMAAALLAVPLAWASDRLEIGILYAVAFAGGIVSVVSGTAGQIVLTQVVRREQLVEAHGKSRIAASLAEVAGPGVAGILINLVGAPLALLANCTVLLASVASLRRLELAEPPPRREHPPFWPQFKEGIRFVAGDRLLLSMALAVGGWQMLQTGAMTTQVLFATRELNLSEFGFGVCLTGAGLCTVAAGALGHHLARRFGPGPTLIGGIAISGTGWLQLALMPAGVPGIVSFVFMLACFSTAVVLIFSTMLALRQAVTPAPMLARMTSTMRWLTLLPAWPGMLLGGALAENFGLRVPLAIGGCGALILAICLWHFSLLRRTTGLGSGIASMTPPRPPALVVSASTLPSTDPTVTRHQND
jgi:MFS family permease